MNKTGVVGRRFWLYSPGERARLWEEFWKDGTMGMGPDEVGDLTRFPNKKDIGAAMIRLRGDHSSHRNDVHALWQFLCEMSIGDVVFAKCGTSRIVGRGVVESDYRFDSTRSEYKHVRGVKWTHKGEWEYPGKRAIKMLTDITPATEVEARVLGGR